MDIYTGVVFGLAGIVGVGIFIQLLGLVGLLAFRFRKTPPLNPSLPLPGVTIIKPCFSDQDNEKQNFEIFFDQDYPGPVQLLFVVSRETDPIVPLIRNLLKAHPKADAKLVISTTRRAYWLKVDAMYDAHREVKNEVVIWSDSDAIVHKNYIREMVASLLEPGVSLVTTPQYDARINNFATALKALGNNCDVATYVMILHLFARKKTVAWGHSLAFKRSEFSTFEKEAWQKLSTCFGDDLVLPALFVEHGYKVAFRNIYCPVQFSDKSLPQMISQQERFALCQRAYLGRRTFLLGLVISPVISATVLCLIAPFDPLSLTLWIAAFGTRVFVSTLFEILILKSVGMTLRYFWTIPLWDLLRVYLVTYGCFHSVIEYHGTKFRFAGRYLLEKLDDSNPIHTDSRNEWAQRETDPASARFPW